MSIAVFNRKKCVLLVAVMILFAVVVPVLSDGADAVNLMSPSNGAWTNQTNNTLPFQFNYTGDNASAQCWLMLNGVSVSYNGTVLNATPTALYSNASFSVGANLWNVTCVINSTPVSSPTWTLNADTVAPAVSLASPANGTNSTNATLAVVFTPVDATSSTANCTLYTSGGAGGNNATAVNNTATALAYNAASADSYSWNVSCIDLAGNANTSETRVWTFDNATPIITINAPANGTGTMVNSTLVNATLNGTKTQISAATFTFSGATSAVYAYNGSTNTANCTNVTQGSELFVCIFNASALSDGNNTLTVQAWDAVGNIGTSSASFIVDANAPVITVTGPSNASGQSSGFNITDTIAEGNVSLAQFKILDANGTAVVNYTNQSLVSKTNTTYNYTAYINVTPLSEGNYTIIKNVTDGAGRSAQASLLFYYDKTAPSTPTFSLSSYAPCTGATITYTCTATDNSQSFGANVTISVTGISTSSAGTNTAICTATDIAGNAANATQGYTVSACQANQNSGGGGASAPQAVQTFVSPAAGSTLTMPVAIGGLTVSDLIVNMGNFSASTVQLTVKLVTALDNATPAINTTSRNGSLYAYMQINSTLASSNTKSAKLKFSVPKSWLTQKGYDAAGVALYRLTTDWTQLTTRILSSDSNNYYFEADIPGFSMFSIFTAKVSASSQTCTPGYRRCYGSDTQFCNSNGTAWQTENTCMYGCNSTSMSCNTAPVSATNQTGNATGNEQGTAGAALNETGGLAAVDSTVIIVVAIIVIVAVAVFLYFKKFKGKVGKYVHSSKPHYSYKPI